MTALWIGLIVVVLLGVAAGWRLRGGPRARAIRRELRDARRGYQVDAGAVTERRRRSRMEERNPPGSRTIYGTQR
jgi:hypothetical protein